MRESEEDKYNASDGIINIISLILSHRVSTTITCFQHVAVLSRNLHVGLMEITRGTSAFLVIIDN